MTHALRARGLTAILCGLVIAVFALASSGPAKAHSFNESYVYFDVTDTTLSGRIEVTLNELAKVLYGRADVEAPLTQAEAQENLPALGAYFAEHLRLSDGGQPLDVTFTDLTFFASDAGIFSQLMFDVQGIGQTPVTLQMSYDAIFSDIDPEHRGYALISTNTRNGMEVNESYISLIFAPGDGAQTLYLNDEKSSRVAMAFLEHGVWHIWLGFDHVLFLVTLLVSAVMLISAGRWEPAPSLRESLKRTVTIVTVFTIAHTITLSLATFGIITLPVVLVEAVIALSIAVVALGNLFPRFHAQSWKVVFIFGLFHGFGFANVLEPLGLDPARKALGLVAFNIGVELGQLAIVILLFPVLFALRQLASYRLVALQAGSVALIAVAIFWFAERTLGAFAPASVALAGG
ncbi:HupE/UreJ family protein [Roseobacter sp. S98]|uniref:HupE/UreJ family protein n=1 Tax=Roseobacter algicola (ex Choi et al. 2025) (nom. illeg.) TaxID=3092138 RepID=UPI0035C682A6